jgi:hypothetical protein
MAFAVYHVPRRLAHAALLMAALCRIAQGQEIGTITGHEATSSLNRGTGWTAAARAMHVAVGNRLRTESGRLAVLVFDEFRPGDREVFVLERNTEFTVAGSQGGTQGFSLVPLVRAELHRGGVRWLGPGEVLAPPLGARAMGTEFIVRRSDRGVAEVVVLDGVVQVWNLSLDRAPISVGAGQRSRVEPGRPPTDPETLSAEALQQYLGAFQFVGGGVPEGQTANSSLITGEGIPPPDRAVFRDPASPPGDDQRRERSESPPFDQPQPLVTSPQLGVDF